MKRSRFSVKVVAVIAASVVAFCAARSPAADSQPAMIAFSAGGAEVVVSRQGADYLRFGLAAWGPDWAWTGWKGATRSEQGATVGQLSATLGGAGVEVQLKFRAAPQSPKQMVFTYELTAQRDTPLTLIAVEILPGKAFDGRTFTVHAGGRKSTVKCPLERRGLGNDVERVEMADAAGRRSVLSFQPPANIPSDGAARVVLAQGKLQAGRWRGFRREAAYDPLDN